MRAPFNIFSGARRLALVIAVLYLLGCGAYSFFGVVNMYKIHRSPTVSMYKYERGGSFQRLQKEVLKHNVHKAKEEGYEFESEWNIKYATDQATNGLYALLIGLGLFYGFVLTIGWIVRGFLGIPRGLDHWSNR